MTDRLYRHTVHYLQHKLSAQQAITDATADLQAAYEGIAGCDAPILLLEKAHAAILVALRETRAMKNVDDAAPAA